MEKLKGKSGQCPYCNSTNVDYGDSELVDNQMYYEVSCLDCEQNYQEWYSMEFCGNYGNKSLLRSPKTKKTIA